MSSMIDFDEFGPEKILEVYDAESKMHGFVVIDSTLRGPAKGGIRMTTSVSVEEVSRLARAMTWKCALAELPFGGGKSGIVDNTKGDRKKKQEVIEAFGRALKQIAPSIYIAAPDINTAEQEMEWFVNGNGDKKSCTGKPARLGGLPHELGSTGFGVYHSTLVALQTKKIDVKKARIAIEGFGNVGWFAAKFLSEKGAKIVAVSDSSGVIFNKDGLDFNELAKVKKEKGKVTAYGKGKILSGKEILSIDADVLITAAIPDLITKENVGKVKAGIIVEGSNIPTTHEIEEQLIKKGKFIIPDFVANAGGVISSYCEYKGLKEKEMFKLVEEKLVKNTQLAIDNMGKHNNCVRCSAMDIAIERVRKGIR